MDNQLQEGQWTTGVVIKSSPIGMHVRLDDKREGLLYKNVIFTDIFPGDEVKVFIKKIRDDGKIDLALEQGGYKNAISGSTETILQALQAAGGYLPYSDKSSPAEIQNKFHMSKKRFKEAIGALYKARRIQILEKAIRLV